MPMNFPDTPTNGQTFTSGGVVWMWNGTVWNPTAAPGAAGASTVTIADTAPIGPAPGNLWWNSSPSEGQLYIQYNDGSSAQWVTTNNFSGGGLYLPLAGGTINPGPLVINANTTAPPAGQSGNLVIVPADATNGVIALDTYGASVNPFIVARRSRGTAAAPSAVQNGDGLLAIVAEGYAASAFGTFGNPGIAFTAAENWTATAQGSQIRFQTAVIGTNAVVNSLVLQGNTATFSGAITAVGGTFSGSVAINTTASGGYSDNFRLTNTSAGATNSNKYLRVGPTGSLEIVNSAFNAVPFTFSDTGDFSCSGNIVLGTNIYFANVAVGSTGPRMSADTTNFSWVLGTGNSAFNWYNNAGTRLCWMNNAGAFLAQSSVYFSYTNAQSFYATCDGTNYTFNFTSDGWRIYWRSNDGALIFMTYQGTAIWYCTGTGDTHQVGNVFAANVSDARTKKNVEPYTRGLADLIQLKPVSYQYNGLGHTTNDGRVRYGLTAQAAQPYIPECVAPTHKMPRDPTCKDLSEDDGYLDGQLSLHPEPLVFALINAVKELAAKVEILEARLA
jgi:hypothetical protein